MNSLWTHKYNTFFIGYFIALWEEIADRVGITYETWCVYPSGYTAIAGDVSNGVIDIAVGDFSLTSSRYEIVDFIYPYDNSGRLVLFYEPGTFEQTLMFLRPFDWYLWILILCSFVWIAHLVWILEWNTDTFLKPISEQDSDDTCCCRCLSSCWKKLVIGKNNDGWIIQPFCCCLRWWKPFMEPSTEDLLEIEDEENGMLFLFCLLYLFFCG